MARKKEVVIFEKAYNGERRFIRFKDFPKDLLPDDMVTIQIEEAFYTENNSSDGQTNLIIKREVEMTPEEIAKEKEFFANLRIKSKQERYEKYLTLKKEFENGNI